MKKSFSVLVFFLFVAPATGQKITYTELTQRATVQTTAGCPYVTVTVTKYEKSGQPTRTVLDYMTASCSGAVTVKFGTVIPDDAVSFNREGVRLNVTSPINAQVVFTPSNDWKTGSLPPTYDWRTNIDNRAVYDNVDGTTDEIRQSTNTIFAHGEGFILDRVLDSSQAGSITEIKLVNQNTVTPVSTLRKQ